MISFDNLAIRRGARQLFSAASFTVHRGQRVGVTGANGCGKSSLFSLLLGELHSDEGEVEIPSATVIAHVAQETPASDRSALDYVLDGDIELRQVQRRLDQAELNNDGEAQAHCHSRLDEIDAYSAESRAGKLMLGLGFEQSQLQQPVKTFSGGWRMRLNLAQALMCRSDLLLLDEPTNHLDLDAVIWLEQWLQSYSGTLLLISHDRDFLDSITTHIIHIEQQHARLYTGNYSAFEKLRAEQLALQQSQYEKQQREIAHIESFIRRFKAKASKARQAQGRVKALQRMELVAAAHVDSPFHFSFFAPEKLPHPLLRLEEVSVGYDQQPIVEKLNMSILPGARIALLGHNGAGKSTLIKLLAGELHALEGHVECSSELKTGYFAQHQLEQLDPEASAMLQMQRLDAKLTEQQIRDYLGGYDFHGDRVLEPVAPFSGGEKARLVLALLIYQKPNLLLLDEPTNHLDLDMRHALSMALQNYQGAMVLVSHDRHLLRSVSDEFLLVDQGRAEPFNDDLDAYRKWLLQPREDESAIPFTEAGKLGNRKQQRQQEAEKRRQLQPLKKQLAQLERNMEKLQSQLDEVEQALADPGMYTAENRERMETFAQQRHEVQLEMQKLEEDWLIKSEELENLQASL